MSKDEERIADIQAKLVSSGLDSLEKPSELREIRDRLDTLSQFEIHAGLVRRRDRRQGIAIILVVVSVLAFLVSQKQASAPAYLDFIASDFEFESHNTIALLSEGVYLNSWIKVSPGAIVGAGDLINNTKQFRKVTIASLEQLTPNVKVRLWRTPECDALELIEGNLYGQVNVELQSKVASTSAELLLDAKEGNTPFLKVCGERERTLDLVASVKSLKLYRPLRLRVQDELVLSSIVSGTYSIRGQSLALTPLDVLEAHMPMLRNSAIPLQSGLIRAHAQGFQVVFSGKVSSLKVGVPGLTEEKVPNWITYFLKDSPAASLYSLAAGGIALVWGFRKMFGRID